MSLTLTLLRMHRDFVKSAYLLTRGFPSRCSCPCKHVNKSGIHRKEFSEPAQCNKIDSHWLSVIEKRPPLFSSDEIPQLWSPTLHTAGIFLHFQVKKNKLSLRIKILIMMYSTASVHYYFIIGWIYQYVSPHILLNHMLQMKTTSWKAFCSSETEQYINFHIQFTSLQM